jgi:uncharacterized protein YdeI (YjbR/CyaY-like superfamily)
MDRSEKVEAYFAEEHRFKKAVGKLRDIVLKTEMDETFKWAFPTYTWNNKNVVGICRFKNHFGIWFYNGVFLSDPHNVLENAQEGKTQAMRHWKFKSIDEIDSKKTLAYINEALENEKKGIKLMPKKRSPVKVVVPELLKKALKADSKTNAAFEKLSPSKRRDYAEYIATAKQEKTKLSRLEKILPMIAAGTGLNDMYR